MSNDQYLIVSYFVVAGASLATGVAVYLYLRRPFEEMLKTDVARKLAAVLRRLFPVGLVFPALLGFISVSYQSCEKQTYEAIVADRHYLVHKNWQQVSATLFALAVATLFWNLVLIIVKRYSRTTIRS